MKLNNTTEYALRILAFMMKEPEKIYTASHLVDKLGISDKYLRRIMTNMSKAGFVRSIQGREGGYVFNTDAKQIYVADVIDATEGLNKHLACVLGLAYCSAEQPCPLHHAFEAVRNEFIRIVHTQPIAGLDFSTIARY